MSEFQYLSEDYSPMQQSSTVTCFKEDCKNIPEYLCKCEEKRSLMCNLHIGDHIKPFPQNHMLESIFEAVNFETQKALINFLREEKQSLNEIQSKIIEKLSMTFIEVEDYIEKELKSITDEVKQIDNLIEFLGNTKEVDHFYWIYTNLRDSQSVVIYNLSEYLKLTQVQ
ncbi:unnamed protein product [Blepharisma stoltei]|uniref:Uncharacterized protein n=1 Tax=Blepharisma stoltei TaxID=1481888 RepID=A0AAU9KK82_9CILI|nr:unnamed protein product [Blepharisma stoltei]